MGHKLEMIETGMIVDTYVSGLGDAECIGNGMLRFYFFAYERGQRTIVAKLVAPRLAVPHAIGLAAQAVRENAAERVDLVH